MVLPKIVSPRVLLFPPARIKICIGIMLLSFLPVMPLIAQNAPSASQNLVSLGPEISRLEGLSSGSAANNVAGDRYNSFMRLARLNQLAGNTEAALRAYEGALSVSPGDSRALLEQGRLYISFGEYEKANAAIQSLLAGLSGPENGGRDLSIQSLYLAAQIGVFQSGDTRPLEAMAEEAAFAAYRSGIYYTLWKITGRESYLNLLAADFPQSPEAWITSGRIGSDPTPLWLLFPGRDSIAAAPQNRVLQPPFLQTGLFSREENARAHAESLGRSGFEAQVTGRRVNNADYWAVIVSGGTDINAEIKKLKDAGFDSFPVR